MSSAEVLFGRLTSNAWALMLAISRIIHHHQAVLITGGDGPGPDLHEQTAAYLKPYCNLAAFTLLRVPVTELFTIPDGEIVQPVAVY